ncbi:hypothetical protein KR222_010515 [Zaprionus bogoriensis]|nr:hypothetical protein KR222_010515 [Zaprionus bogoriensis]
MFWDKGYAPSANIEALLEKENSTVEELLDEEDILQECKTQKKNLVNYFTRPEVIRRLVELITTEPSEEVPMAQRFRYANMSCEILTLGLPSLDEKLLSDTETLQLLYSYLEKEPPLNPLLSSFFSKTFSMLFTKKPEQDWFLYQHMCLQLLEYIKSQKNFLEFICKHFDTPVIPDLIMQMMKDIDGGQLKRNLYEWLTEDKLVERLIAILRNPQETDKHANVADFFCDLINQGRLMRQTEQENDSFEPAFDGSNPILRTIESTQTIEALLNVILEPNALESAILSGISVVLTLIKPITFTDEPNSDRQLLLQKREREFHRKLQGTVTTVIAPRLNEFVNVLKNPPAKPTLETTAATLSPPFGKTRLQVCRVFTALLEIRHESLQKAICDTEYFSLLLVYFKEYCWNNFLHSELEKALQLVFSGDSNTSNENLDDFIHYLEKCTNNALMLMNGKRAEGGNESKTNNDALATTAVQPTEVNAAAAAAAPAADAAVDAATAAPDAAAAADQQNTDQKAENAITAEGESSAVQENHIEQANSEAAAAAAADASQANQTPTESVPNDLDKAKAPKNNPPTEMQTYLIVNCQLVSKLVYFWRHNAEAQSAEKGRRLGYMGHLIKIVKHITTCISESEHIAALIAANFVDESDLKYWQALIDAEEGEFTKAVTQQGKLLANWNPHEDNEFNIGEHSMWDYFNSLPPNDDMKNTLHEILTFDHDDDDDEEQGGSSGDGHGIGMYTITLNDLTADPWDMEVQFAEANQDYASTLATTSSNWDTDFKDANFADFDAHFSSHSSDLGAPPARLPTTMNDLLARTTNTTGDEQQHQRGHNDDDISMTATLMEDHHQAEYDNNANVEKSSSEKSTGDLNDAEALATNTAAATSIVSRLQSVLLDGEEDYEDDEGMWTKPLGGSSSSTTESQQSGALSNGPSKAAEL